MENILFLKSRLQTNYVRFFAVLYMYTETHVHRCALLLYKFISGFYGQLKVYKKTGSLWLINRLGSFRVKIK